MKKTIKIDSSYNAFTVSIGGRPSATSICDNYGKLLRKSLVKSCHHLTHLCSPGEYIVETDGEILDIEMRQVKQRPFLVGLTPDNLDDVYAETDWSGVDDDSEKLKYIKEELTEYYSALSFQARVALLPEYKLQNAVLGIYDQKTQTSYRNTVEGFRKEFHRIKKAIESAKTLEKLKAIKADFPTEISSAE